MPVKYMNVGTYIFIRENKKQLELLNKMMENYEPTEYDKKVMEEALKQKIGNSKELKVYLDGKVVKTIDLVKESD